MSRKKPEPKPGPRLKLLGIGAAKDRALKANLEQALVSLGWEIPILEVRDINELLAYGISGIPALVVDDRVVFQQVVPSVEDLSIVLQVLLTEDEINVPLKQLVVPTDFSETADNALQYAIGLASVMKARVKVVHIHQPLVDMGSAVHLEQADVTLPSKQLLMSRLIEDSQWLAKRNRVPIVGQVIPGYISAELKELSEAATTNLIVMGTTGQSGVLGKWLGSTSSELARKAGCPVILIPRQAQFSGIQNIVYASDHKPGDGPFLKKLLQFSCLFDATLHAVHIDISPQQAYEVAKVPIGKANDQGRIEWQLSEVRAHDVLTGLTTYATDHHADMMVMATSRRGFLEDLFRRKMTREMTFQTQIPLLVLHYEA